MKHLLQNHLRLLILAISPIFLTACGSDDRGGYTCAAVLDLNGAVRVTAKDTNGQPLSGYKVTYQVNNGGNSSYPHVIRCETTEECVLLGNGGEYSLIITKDGFETTSLKVTVRSGFCSVFTEKVAVTLKSLT